MIRPDAELRYLKGVGPRRAEALSREGLETVDDLLYVLPFRYEDRRAFARVEQLRSGGEECTLAVTVESARLIRTRKRGFTIFEAQLADESGSIKAVWYNQPYLERVFTAGRRMLVYGAAADDRYGRSVLENPDHEPLDEDDGEGVHTGRIVPVYRKRAELSSRMLRTLLFRVLTEIEPGSLADLVPPEIAARHGMLPRLEALRGLHFPEPGTDMAALAERATPAQRSLVFEEIFLLQLALAVRRDGVQRLQRGVAYEVTDGLKTRLGKLLPFKLTGAQKRVVAEIGADLRASHPMNRLLQGDVGSGKTIVALLTLLVAIDNGYQGALMAPTEILAEQHYRNVSALLERGGIEVRVARLTGTLRAAERRKVLAEVASGESSLVVGTHALFEAGVEFHRLGLAVIDEQHRFGVLQRAALAGKGARPDMLVMTATPIPRTLAMTLYGDLDVSVIDELPPGRTPVETVVRAERDRDRVWDGIRKAAAMGRQAYVVVPLVEESRKSDLKAATSLAQQLQEEVFPELSVGLVHGRLKPDEKEAVMSAFVAGRLDVLVATTVIEVGVDVPNATVMVIEHADRFGLSQLHQLRGRVGRGGGKSYCVLMADDGASSATARERLGVMVETTDGFKISERDLELRGPGAVFGTQQHGLSDLRFLAEVLRAPLMLEAARTEAVGWIEAHGAEAGRRKLDALGGQWRRRLELARVG